MSVAAAGPKTRGARAWTVVAPLFIGVPFGADAASDDSGLFPLPAPFDR